MPPMRRTKAARDKAEMLWVLLLTPQRRPGELWSGLMT